MVALVEQFGLEVVELPKSHEFFVRNRDEFEAVEEDPEIVRQSFRVGFFGVELVFDEIEDAVDLPFRARVDDKVNGRNSFVVRPVDFREQVPIETVHDFQTVAVAYENQVIPAIVGRKHLVRLL